MRSKLEIFHQGEPVPRKSDTARESDAVSESARTAIENLRSAIERDNKTPYLFFDIDGTLLPSGLESPLNQKTVQEYVIEQRDTVELFKRRIEWFRNSQFRFVIITARGMAFAHHVAQNLFPPNSVGTVIAENGAMFARQTKPGESWGVSYPSHLNKEKLMSFRQRCAPLIEFAETALQGTLESGKEIVVTLVPPSLKDLTDFHHRIVEKAKESGLEGLQIFRSAGAVDITPPGATKASGLREVLADNIGVYFVDSGSDEEAMSSVSVNIVPGNAFASTRVQAKLAEVGLLAERQDLDGVTDALSAIEAYLRLGRLKEQP